MATSGAATMSGIWGFGQAEEAEALRA